MSLVVTVARKPFRAVVAENVLKHGTGALHIEVSRVPTEDNLNGGAYAQRGTDRHDGAENWRYKRQGDAGEFMQPSGRWPANLLLIRWPRSSDVDDLGRYFLVLDS